VIADHHISTLTAEEWWHCHLRSSTSSAAYHL